MQNFGKRKTTILCGYDSCNRIFFCKLGSSLLEDADNAPYRTVNQVIANGFAIVGRNVNNAVFFPAYSKTTGNFMSFRI